MTTLTPNHHRLLAAEIRDAVRMRDCLTEAVTELEIAIGFRDWSRAKRAVDVLRSALPESS